MAPSLVARWPGRRSGSTTSDRGLHLRTINEPATIFGECKDGAQGPPPLLTRTMGARPVSYSAPSHREETGPPASAMQCHPLHGRCPRKCAADSLVE
jgi:hypothetical protein